LSPLILIKEREAAALYTVEMMKETRLNVNTDYTRHFQPYCKTVNNLKISMVGDAFAVCDVGGGTVDLISYEITQLKPSLELKELVPGKGIRTQLLEK
jgi:hypothetical protein